MSENKMEPDVLAIQRIKKILAKLPDTTRKDVAEYILRWVHRPERTGNEQVPNLLPPEIKQPTLFGDNLKPAPTPPPQGKRGA